MSIAEFIKTAKMKKSVQKLQCKKEPSHGKNHRRDLYDMKIPA